MQLFHFYCRTALMESTGTLEQQLEATKVKISYQLFAYYLVYGISGFRIMVIKYL